MSLHSSWLVEGISSERFGLECLITMPGMSSHCFHTSILSFVTVLTPRRPCVVASPVALPLSCCLGNSRGRVVHVFSFTLLTGPSDHLVFSYTLFTMPCFVFCFDSQLVMMYVMEGCVGAKALVTGALLRPLRRSVSEWRPVKIVWHTALRTQKHPMIHLLTWDTNARTIQRGLYI